jgi:transketolase
MLVGHFEHQDEAYRNKVLPPQVKARVAGAALLWMGAICWSHRQGHRHENIWRLGS